MKKYTLSSYVRYLKRKVRFLKDSGLDIIEHQKLVDFNYNILIKTQGRVYVVLDKSYSLICYKARLAVKRTVLLEEKVFDPY